MSVAFPLAVSATEGEAVTVYGSASAVSYVRVNGIDAVSTYGFATWSAAVNLAIGGNTHTNQTVDAADYSDVPLFNLPLAGRVKTVDNRISGRLFFKGAYQMALIFDTVGSTPVYRSDSDRVYKKSLW